MATETQRDSWFFFCLMFLFLCFRNTAFANPISPEEATAGTVAVNAVIFGFIAEIAVCALLLQRSGYIRVKRMVAPLIALNLVSYVASLFAFIFLVTKIWLRPELWNQPLPSLFVAAIWVFIEVLVVLVEWKCLDLVAGFPIFLVDPKLRLSKRQTFAVSFFGNLSSGAVALFGELFFVLYQ